MWFRTSSHLPFSGAALQVSALLATLVFDLIPQACIRGRPYQRSLSSHSVTSKFLSLWHLGMSNVASARESCKCKDEIYSLKEWLRAGV